MAFELWSTPSLSPPSPALWKLHSRWVQPLAQGSLLFAPNGGLQSLPREGRMPVLLFFPRLLSQRLCSGWAHWEMSSAERWELPSFPQTHQWDGGATSVVGCWEIPGPQSPSPWLIHKADVPREERQAERTKAYSHTPSTKRSAPEAGMSPREKGAVVPIPSSAVLAWRPYVTKRAAVCSFQTQTEP